MILGGKFFADLIEKQHCKIWERGDYRYFRRTVSCVFVENSSLKKNLKQRDLVSSKE
jgi:hypothetical protein